MCYLPVYPILSPGQWKGMLIDFRSHGQQDYLVVGYRYGLIARRQVSILLLYITRLGIMLAQAAYKYN